MLCGRFGGFEGRGERELEPTFYPGTFRFGDAIAVHVGMGGEPVPGNLEMPLAKKRTVRGMVEVPEGATGVQVRLRPRDPVLAMKFGEKAAEVQAKTGAFIVADGGTGEARPFLLRLSPVQQCNGSGLSPFKVRTISGAARTQPTEPGLVRESLRCGVCGPGSSRDR